MEVDAVNAAKYEEREGGKKKNIYRSNEAYALKDHFEDRHGCSTVCT